MRLLLLLAATLLHGASAQTGPTVAVGSKVFTESVVLGEMATQVARQSGAAAVHRRELGGTRVLWEALTRGDIDVYPEYTGTLVQEIFAGQEIPGDNALRAALAREGVEMLAPLGFNDTYALGMSEARAEALGIASVSDLAAHPDLAVGLSSEFLDRADGWPGVREAYRLGQADVRGLDHDLALRALAAGAIDVTDLYTTDAEIAAGGIRVLRDDRGFFPRYDAVFLVRADLRARAPRAVAAIERLGGRIDEATMIGLNGRARLEGVPEATVAQDALRDLLDVGTEARVESHPERVWRRTHEHLVLVGVSLLAAILVAIPLGIAAARVRVLEAPVLGVVSVAYTIPALALLVVLIPLLGIGTAPALVALFLYALLPVVRNTHAGLTGIAPELRESAEALGLPPLARLARVDLPLAAPSILAGIQTSAVLTVGTATLGALVGAGGYGQPILTGVRLADTGLILEGAVPAALMALAAQALFTGLGRIVLPRGLRGG